MRYTALIVFCILAIACVSSAAAKAIADSTAFQGSLTDASNNPVSDGPRDLTISVWTDSVGGTMLYSEIRTVTTSKGLVTTCIGCGNSTFPDIFDGQTLFLQTQIPGQAPMSPRTRLRGVPYSISASSVNAEATNGSAKARGIISTKPSIGSPKGKMLLDIDVDGNGIADLSAETNVDHDSASFRLNGLPPGVPVTGTLSMAASGTGARSALEGRSGSTTATIRMQASPDSAVSDMDRDSDGDGVPETSDRRTVSANEFHHNTISRSGSTTATIRQMATPDSASTTIDHDSDGDGVPEMSDRRTISSNEFHHNTVARTGSTTATIRQMASPDSVVSALEHDLDGDGHPDLYARKRMINADAKLSSIFASDIDDDGVADVSAETEVGNDSASFRLNGLPPGTPYIGNLSMSASGGGAHQTLSGHTGSTTGTIRQMATPDSASVLGTADTDGDGVPESRFASVARASGSLVRASSEFNLVRNESRMQSSPDSASVHCDADSNGDGHLEAAAVSSVTKLSGGGGGAASASYAATGRLYVDNNSDGTPDNEIESIVTPTTSSVAINTKGTGADKNRVISTTNTDGASFQASSEGINIGIYVSATSGQSAIVMTDSSGGGLDTTVYIDGKNAKVGIGVSQPTARLQVVGGAYCDGTDWVNASDRNVKENFEPVNGEELLDRISELPITKWNYIGDSQTEHIGPTAQDFLKTFGVGSDGKSISTIDPSGIALAAIKELGSRNKKLERENQDLRTELEELKVKVEKLVSGK